MPALLARATWGRKPLLGSCSISTLGVWSGVLGRLWQSIPGVVALGLRQVLKDRDGFWIRVANPDEHWKIQGYSTHRFIG